jgi:hypothetical protein
MTRKLTVKSNNTEVYVSSYTTYINDKSITDIINENIEAGTFRAKVTIIIEELESDIFIEGTKKEEILEVEDEFKIC